MKMKAFLVLLCLPAAASLAAAHPGAGEFATMMAREHGFDRGEVLDLVADAEKQPAIIEAMESPAEALPWYRYRAIFLTPSRIGAGVAFWNEHEPLLERARQTYGVSPAVIVAILGVESRYGDITGSHRVLDSLVTLAFYYPPRADFFRSELEQFLLLGREEAINLRKVEGSYAGAMGLGQFISSSYRAYAVDFDGDGQRNLWQTADAVGSVANYLSVHGWQPGAPVAVKAKATPSAEPLPHAGLKPQWTVRELSELGYKPVKPVKPDARATLIELTQPDGPEYWLGLKNFYVITRYNHSALYAMAVFQLSRAIAQAREYTTNG